MLAKATLVRLTAVLLGAASIAAAAQERFPARPVRIVVPFVPGGLIDVMGRAIAPRLSEAMGQSVLVENRPGAGGAIGAEAVAKAAPDGYTLLFTVDATLLANPLLYTRSAYQTADFVPVTLVAQGPDFLMVNASVPAGSVAELVAHAKANPGKLNYGSFGVGTVPQFETESFKLATGTDIVHVPYKGLGEVVPALVSNNVQLVFSAAAIALPQIKAGRVKVLAVMSPERSPYLPDVPTFAETGYPELNSKNWFGIVAPAKTRPEVVRYLASELGRVMATPEFEKNLQGWFLEPVTPGVEHFARVLTQDEGRFARIIKTLNIRLD